MEIVTESGKSIKGTHNHPLLASMTQDRRLVREWRRLDQFKVGDRVAVVSGFNCTVTAYVDTDFAPITRNRLGPKFHRRLPTKVTPELAAFLGYMVGDGWVCKDGYRLGFVVAQPEVDLLPRLLALARGLFGFNNKPVETVKKGRKVHLHYVYLSDKDVAHNLAFLREKRVPDLIFQSGDRVVASFLTWLFEADGCVFDNGRGRRAVSLKARDIELLRDVQLLLLRFGIHSRIVGNALMIRRGESIIKFAKDIGFVSKKKVAKMKELATDAGSFKHFHAQHSERVVKVVQGGITDVYDIEVPDGHRFIANGIVSHNTAKSELLKYVSRIAPRGLYTTGRGSTAAGLCVAPDSLVTTEDGSQTIAELVEGQLTAGEKVIESGETVCQNPRPKRVVAPRIAERNILVSGNRQSYVIQDLAIEAVTLGTASQYYRINAPRILRIKTRLGREIALTPETKLASYDRRSGQVLWKRAEDIRRGDSLVLTTQQPDLARPPDTGPLSLLDDTDFVELNPACLEGILSSLRRKYGKLRSAAHALRIDENKLYHYWPKRITNPRFGDLKAIAQALGLDLKTDIEPQVRNISYKSYSGIEKIKAQWDTYSLMYFLGSIYSDGCVGIDRREGRSYSTRFSSGDYEDCIRYRTVVGELFGIEPRIEKESKENCYDVRFSNKFVSRLLKRLGMPAGVKPNDLRMTSAVTSLPSRELARFLSGLFDHDGCVTRGRCVSFATSSGILARQVEQALERYDIIAGIRRKRPAVAETHGVVIRSKGTYEVEIYDGISLGRFAERVAFDNPKKQQRLYELISKRRASHSNFVRMGYGLIAAAVVGVTEEPASVVYDLTIDDVHSFVANGFIVHNTAAVVKEKSGLMMLEAGAVVLADQGVACIDEFDKMRVEDRGVLHEVMEQQSFHPSFEFTLASGRRVRIGDYVEGIFRSNQGIVQGKDCQIVPLRDGDEVFSYDFSRGASTVTKIDRVSRHRPPKHFVRLTFSSGEEVVVTPEHPVYVLGRAEATILRADKVEAGCAVPACGGLRSLGMTDGLQTIGEGTTVVGRGISTLQLLHDGSFLRVVGAETIGNKGSLKADWVYDVTIEPFHNFVSNGLILHNTVSVAKGGIVATLNARTSILAAANPVFGKYDPYKNIYENVNLPTPLLTRFDLVFIIRDIPDRAKDEKLASHILETHRAEAFIVQPPLDFAMLRKYLIYAKKVTPKLTREAQERLLQFYLDLRASSTEGTIAITPRQLEGLIRISTARARLLLRDKVTIEDALQAINLMRKMLESVGIDVRTGKVDLGVLQGRPASERSILEKAMDVFRQLHGPEKKPVEAKAFVDELVKTGDFSAEEARRVISTLYKLGQIYEIRSGYYSKIS
jgi:DNA replicative helicase MCM subunit Mcm2 (Cdc46/Mcm family)